MYGPTGPRKLRGDKRVLRQACRFPNRMGTAGREGNYYICWNCGWRANKDRDALGPGSGVSSVAFPNVLTGGTASASTENGSNTADKAVDGSTTTYWEATATPATWTYDLGAGNTAVVTILKIRPYFSTNAAVKDWVLWLSQDGETLEYVDEGQVANSDELQTFEINGCWKARYFHVEITSTWGGNPAVYEFDMREGLYYPSVSSGCPFCGCRNYA